MNFSSSLAFSHSFSEDRVRMIFFAVAVFAMGISRNSAAPSTDCGICRMAQTARISCHLESGGIGIPNCGSRMYFQIVCSKKPNETIVTSGLLANSCRAVVGHPGRHQYGPFLSTEYDKQTILVCGFCA